MIKKIIPITNQSLAMEKCERFGKCIANICPLDTDWQKRIHLKGERVCFYLTESQKVNAKEIFEGRGLGNLFKHIQDISYLISAQHCTIRRALEKAKYTPSRIVRKIGGPS